MSNKVYIHIGLHKTATRFLQRSVFSTLDGQRFNNNPKDFLRALLNLLRDPNDALRRRAFEDEYKRVTSDPRDLLISLPDISGDMYNSHQNARANLDIIKQYFPEARIMYFVRRHSDWLLSAYRQSMQKGPIHPIEVFLNFYDGEFQRKTYIYRGGMRNVDALGLRLFEIYQIWADAYRPENVWLIRYEDFRKDRRRTGELLAEWLQVEALPPAKGGNTRHNRSFSALAVQLFGGGAEAPRTPPKGSNKRKKWLGQRWPVHLVRNLRRIFIRKIFDRIIYKDWDMLARGGMREKLDNFYEEENRRLEQHARR